MPFSFRCQVWGYVWVTMFCVVIFLFQPVKLAKTVKNHCLTRFLLKSSNLCFAEGFVIQLKVPAVPEIYTPFSQDFWEGQPSDNPKSNWSFPREENYPRSGVHITCDTYLLISCNRSSCCSKLSIQKYHASLNGLVGSSCKQTYGLSPPSMTKGGGICSGTTNVATTTCLSAMVCNSTILESIVRRSSIPGA